MPVRKRPDTGAWIIDFRYITTKGERARYKATSGAASKGAAQSEERRLRDYCAQHGHPPLCEAEALTLSEFTRPGGKWELCLVRLRPATQERYRAMLKQGIDAALGEIPLNKLDAPAVLSYLATVAARKIETRPHLSLIRTILRDAKALKIKQGDRRGGSQGERKVKRVVPTMLLSAH